MPPRFQMLNFFPKQRLFHFAIRSPIRYHSYYSLRRFSVTLPRFDLSPEKITVSKPQLKVLPKSTLLIDVREPNEVAEGIIPGAKHIPVGELRDALQLGNAEFKKKYGFEKFNKTDDVVFYCRSGRRSLTAVTIADSLGFENVKHYDGGWLGWTSD